jgi:hypothetical protein
LSTNRAGRGLAALCLGGGNAVAIIEVAMPFKQEFLTALRSGTDHRALLEIVRRHHGGDEAEKGAYEVLEQIWRDLGFDESAEPSPLRDELEYVMERVWYFGANAG